MDATQDTPGVYPHVPPLPTSASSYTFQPSAPPSAPSLPHSVPSSSSLGLYPDLNYSPSAPPPPSLSFQEPWRATSHIPTEADLQSLERLYPSAPSPLPSAPPRYPLLSSDQDEQLLSSHHTYPHELLQPHSLLAQTQDPTNPSLELNLSRLRVQADWSAKRLIEIYENEQLDGLHGRLRAYKESAAVDTTDDAIGAFFDRMSSYEAAHGAVQQARLAVFNLQQKAKGYASKLWKVETKSEVVKATCGDGATIYHNYSYQYGQHEPEVAFKLKKALHRLYKQRAKSLVRMQFEETSCQLWIQDHLATFMNSILWGSEGSNLDQKQDIGRTPRTRSSSNAQDLRRIQHYLDVLFQFERSARRQPDFESAVDEWKAGSALSEAATVPSTDVQSSDSTGANTNLILQSIQRWIALLAAALLQHGGLVEYEYLTVQVLRTRQISSWAAIFVQCNVPMVWSNMYQNFYIAQLELVLCGATMLTLRTRDGQKEELGPLIALGTDLEEDDYLALLDQLDVTLFFSRLLQEHMEIHSNDSSVLRRELSERSALRLLTTARYLFDSVIYALQRLTAFNIVRKRLSQLLCQLGQILGDHLFVLGPMDTGKHRNSAQLDIRLSRDNTTTLQAELDHILLDITRTLIALPSQGLWTFLPSVPFKFMTSTTIALLLEEIALDDFQIWVENPSALLSTSPEFNKLRGLLGSNPGEAVFLLTAMANMLSSRFLGDLRGQDTKSISLEHNIAVVITFLLLDAAYLDEDIRAELTKPTRETLSSICDSYPRTLSSILRFVEMNFNQISDVAQYLFRGLPLEEWRLSDDDFASLMRLLETAPLSSPQSLFARYIFSSLPWSQSEVEGADYQGDGRSRIPLMYRKELALGMAGVCIRHLTGFQGETPVAPSDNKAEAKEGLHHGPARTKSSDQNVVASFASTLPHAFTNLAAHSGIHRSAEQTSMKAFMDWCWSMLGKLRLTDVPTLSLVEASRLHVQDPGMAKYPLFSQGQLTFINTVHLLLTEASRDADQFLQEGWSTLGAILQTGAGSVFLDLAGHLIPSILDTTADPSAHTIPFGQLLRNIASWKQDPLLTVAGSQLIEAYKLSPTKASKELFGIWCLLKLHTKHSQAQSGGDLAKVLRFWMDAVFSQKEWMVHQECVQVLDIVCLFCFEFGLDRIIRDGLTEQQILLSIGFRRAPGMSAELMGLAQPGLDRVMDMLPERVLKTLPVPQGSNDPSLLMGTWSVRSFAANLLTQQAMVEANSLWFAYYVLATETALEQEMRIKVGSYYLQHPAELKVHGNIKSAMKTIGITSRKTLHNFAIWRWAQHLLILRFDTFLLPLFWQMFFYLYFGHTEQQSLFYGFKFLETSPDIVEQLRDRLQKTYTYFGQEARKAIQELNASKAAPLTALHEFYIALYGWISEPLLLSANIDLKRIRKDLMADRLMTCRLPDPLECSSELWKDLLVEWRESSSVFTPSSPSSVSLRSPITCPSHGSPHSGFRSHDDARAIRKHNHAWQEQKNSHCLVQQAKPGPEFYVPRVLVQLAAIDSRTSPQALFSQPTRTIRNQCKVFQATNEAYENLDVSYLAELSSLYHNEVRTSKLEIACDTTPNTLCKRAAAFELSYEEIVLNEQVRLSIIENRERARASKLGSVEQSLCLATLEVTKTIDILLKRWGTDSANAALQNLCVQSFYLLCNELLEDARIYPPAHITFTSTVNTLGMEIVAKDPHQTEPILNMMRMDDFKIAVLYRTFYPAALPSEFVRLYQRIATCKEYGLASKDLLLRQFDVQAWACARESEGQQQDPSVLDRLAFYEVAFSAMVAQQQLQKQDDQIQEATELSTKERLAIIKSHRELAGTLLLNFLQQDNIEYLRILFNTCGIMCLEPEVLEDFVRILGAEPKLIPALLDEADVIDDAGPLGGKGSKAFTNVGLSDYDFERLVQFLVEYFLQCQDSMVRGNLLDRYSGYAVSIASLITVILCDERYMGKWMKPCAPSMGYSISLQAEDRFFVAAQETYGRPRSGEKQPSREPFREQILVPSHCRMWHDTLRIFQPWLSCLTDHAVDETRFQRQQSGASRLLFTFVGVVSKMMSALQAYYLDTSPMLAEIFGLWVDMMHQTTMGQGCINHTMLIHQHFQRLEWKGLELSRDRVNRILEVAAELSEEVQVEFWTFLVTVMEKAGSDLRPKALQSEESRGRIEWHQSESAFLRLGLRVLQDVDLIVGNDMELRQLFLNRIWIDILDTGDWTLMSTEELKSQVENLKVHWCRAGLWDDLSSPLGQLLYWMRIAVGLESTELDDGGPNRRGCNAIRLNHERVLLYFGYVLRLLQARLASSAQDSQNINFKMDAILQVIPHLGQVLDRIAGSCYEEQHATIYRPLSSLIGVLNQCGKGSSPLASSTCPYVHSFDVVQRALAMMISEVEVIQLDIVKVVCQRINSIPAMINLLEEAIEREFSLWVGQQGSSWGFTGAGSRHNTSGSVFGLEDTSAPQTMLPIPIKGHARSLQRHSQSGFGDRPAGSVAGVAVAGKGGETDGRRSWIRIKGQMEAPELSEEEFLEQGLKQGAILTIYARFLQRLDEYEQSMDFDEALRLGQELAEVISKVDLMAIEPWKAYQSLLLLRMFFYLIAKESVHSILQSRFLGSLKQVCRSLEVWCQDRDSAKGMLSAIGMGTRSSFDTKFRLVIRIMYTYVVTRLADKGVSIHQAAGHGGAGGNMLAWRKGRQLSEGGGGGRGSPLEGHANGVNSKDSNAALVETLAQLPVKNKDYAVVFLTPQQPSSAVAATGDPSSMIMSMSIPLVGSPISILPALASSPLGLVKKTIMPSPSALSSSSGTPPPRPGPLPWPTTSLSTTTGAERWPPHSRPVAHEFKTSQLSHGSRRSSLSSSLSSIQGHRHHPRHSINGSSWNDTTGSIALFEEMSEPNGVKSTNQGLIAPKRWLENAGVGHHDGASGGTGVIGIATSTEHRVRLQQGTKNGTQDLDWAVQQIKDRRFQILETVEVLDEVLNRFYDGDDYFA
ncbi:Ectopic P granules protein 5 [Mortierella claussenii]|nr:Ectopic P granules protein 5 [Mortierella claussenii]